MFDDTFNEISPKFILTIESENDTGQSIENTDLKITSETICETEKDDECVEFDKTSCFIATFDKTRNHYTLNKFFKCDACLKYVCQDYSRQAR